MSNLQKIVGKQLFVKRNKKNIKKFLLFSQNPELAWVKSEKKKLFTSNELFK